QTPSRTKKREKKEKEKKNEYKTDCSDYPHCSPTFPHFLHRKIYIYFNSQFAAANLVSHRMLRQSRKVFHSTVHKAEYIHEKERGKKNHAPVVYAGVLGRVGDLACGCDRPLGASHQVLRVQGMARR